MSKSREITPAMWDRMPYPVKTEIEWLRRQVAERDRRIDELQTLGTKDTDKGIVIEPHHDKPQVCPARTAVRFWVEPGTFYIDCMIRQDRASQAPYLYLCGGGLRCTGYLGIRPDSGNTIDVFKEER